jgi:hypothetical protein
MSNEQTALVAVPSAELVLAEKAAARQAEHVGKNMLKSNGVYALGVGVTLIACVPAIHLFLTFVLGGLLLQVCGGVASLHFGDKMQNYLRLQALARATQEKERAAAIAAAEVVRRETLCMVAESVLTKCAGTYAVGQELRIDVADETPKILRIENISTGLNDQDRPVRQTSAQLYEIMAQADGSLKRGKRIANIPAITCSVPVDPEVAPPSPLRDIAEKKLPPCMPRPA